MSLEELAEALGNARLRFWVCPLVEHRRRNNASDMPVVTVEWRGNITHCTAPGCGRSSTGREKSPRQSRSGIGARRSRRRWVAAGPAERRCGRQSRWLR